jgi:SAM-dependent methyltransferase
LAQEQTPESPIRIDIGCGRAKREGFIGLDSIAGPGVDHVLDLTKDRLPFEDATVDHVFSSHFLEHIRAPYGLLSEIARVCKDGATIEFWTPYAFSNEAFLYGHEVLLTEETWMHFYRDNWANVMCGRWLILNINYVVLPEKEKELLKNGVSVDFAIRYFKSVVAEFGVEMVFRRDPTLAPIMPRRTYSHSRVGQRFSLTNEEKPQDARKIPELVSAGLRRLKKLLHRTLFPR